MPLPVHVDGYSGWKEDERPLSFELDGVYRRIYAVGAQWVSPAFSGIKFGVRQGRPDARYFKVRADGKRYILPHDEQKDEWTLQSALDARELFVRPDRRKATWPCGPPP